MGPAGPNVYEITYRGGYGNETVGTLLIEAYDEEEAIRIFEAEEMVEFVSIRLVR